MKYILTPEQRERYNKQRRDAYHNSPLVKELISGKARNFYQNNKDKYREYCERNKERIALRRKEYRDKHKEHLANIKSGWKKDNKLKVKTYYHKRRIATRDLTFETIQMVYETNIKKFGTLTCYLCLNPIKFGARQDHLEHKTPLSRGGTNDIQNLDVACQKCNLSKSNQTEQEFRSLTKKEI